MIQHDVVPLPYGRLAIRDGDLLLSVPPMHPRTSPEDRNRVLDYVARRQFGLAYDLAEAAAEAIRKGKQEAAERLRYRPDVDDLGALGVAA